MLKNAQIFDVAEHAQGPKGNQKLWEPCLPYFGENIGVEYKDLQIHAGEDVGFIYGLTRLNGMQGNFDGAKSLLRLTVRYRKIMVHGRVCMIMCLSPLIVRRGKSNIYWKKYKGLWLKDPKI